MLICSARVGKAATVQALCTLQLTYSKQFQSFSIKGEAKLSKCCRKYYQRILLDNKTTNNIPVLMPHIFDETYDKQKCEHETCLSTVNSKTSYILKHVRVQIACKWGDIN